MSGKERIKQYFEEAILTDEALKNVYDEKKLNDCWDYITKQAKKAATGNCACIGGAEVFKWARDFMYGDIAKDNVNENNNSEIKSDVPEESETSEQNGQGAQTTEEVESAEEKAIDESVSIDDKSGCDEISSETASEEVPEISINLEHKCRECGYYDDKKCLFHHYSVPNENSGACDEFIVKVTAVEGETTKDNDFIVVSDGEIKNRCIECSYINTSEPCHQDEGLCLFKRKNGFADCVVKRQSIACSQFKKLETDDDIKPIKEKLQIEKVEEESAEEIQPVVQKEKKAAVQEYEQPSLFDDLF